MVRLKEGIAKKIATNEEEKILFHQDNAPSHKSIATMAKLQELHFELLLHSPYSPDLHPPATMCCLQTAKEFFKETDLAPVKK